MFTRSDRLRPNTTFNRLSGTGDDKSIVDDFVRTGYCKHESRLVLRSAEIKPLFYDLFIESTIFNNILLVSSDVTFSLVENSACSAIPPHQRTTARRVAPLLVSGSKHARVVTPTCIARACPSLHWERRLARAHAHTTPITQETTVLSTGFDSQLAMNTATLRRQHRIPSDLRS